MSAPQRTFCKDGVEPLDLLRLCHPMLVLLGEAGMYYDAVKLPFWITSLTEGQHSSRTHIEGRGADLRTRLIDQHGKVVWAMSPTHQQQLAFKLNQKYAKDWGTGPEGMDPKVAIVESDHIHLQVRRGL